MKLKQIASWNRGNTNDLYEEVGTYVGVKWDKELAANIKQYMKEKGVPNLIDEKEYHSTLIYSRVGFDHKCTKDNFVITPKDFHVFENKKLNHKALVIKLDSKDLSDRHDQIMKDNPEATYDFPEYIAHQTVSYDIEDFDITQLDINDFINITKDNYLSAKGTEYTEDLDIGKFTINK